MGAADARAPRRPLRPPPWRRSSPADPASRRRTPAAALVAAAGPSPWRWRTGAAAPDELGRDGEPRGRRARALHRVEQEPQRAAAHLAEVLAHGRQRRREVLRLGDVVEADDADRLRD